MLHIYETMASLISECEELVAQNKQLLSLLDTREEELRVVSDIASDLLDENIELENAYVQQTYRVLDTLNDMMVDADTDNEYISFLESENARLAYVMMMTQEYGF